MDPLSYVYIAVGSAFFGSTLVGAYGKLTSNGRVEIAKLEVRLNKLEDEIRQIKFLLNEVLKECIKERKEVLA